MEGNLRLKIHWASLTVEGKFTVFAFLLLQPQQFFTKTRGASQPP